MTVKNEPKKSPVNLIAQRNRDRKMVTGKFIFHEVPGGVMSFSIKLYREDALEKHTLRDGEIYTIPYGVAKHLNTNCWYPVHEHSFDENGQPSMKVSQKVRRCSFQSLQFMEDDDLNAAPEIVNVEKISPQLSKTLKPL